MRARMCGFIVAVVSVAVLVFAGVAGGIVGGAADTTAPYRYPSVGLIETYGFFGDFWMPSCTGTLIAPKVVLTAGHCSGLTELGVIPAANVRVTFDPSPQTIYYPDRPASTHYAVASASTNPDYLARGVLLSGSIAEFGQVPDVGVYILAEAVPAEVATPMAIVAAGTLDALKSTTLTKVGYGYNGFVRGAWGTPNAVPIINGVRTYADATVLTDHDTVSALYVKTSSTSCFGDSGGPSFLNGKVAAVTSFGASLTCHSTDYATRLDTESVQTFLADVLASFG